MAMTPLGPAMKALTLRQRAFVTAMLELGTSNYSQAARSAGYSGDASVIKVTACRLAHDPRVILALNEEAKRKLQGSAHIAVSELIRMVDPDAKQNGVIMPIDGKLKLKAIEMILNRTGHHALSEHRVDVQHSYSDPDTVARIGSLAKQLGMDPVKLLGTAGVQAQLDDSGKLEVIDAEFSVIEQDEDQGPVPDDSFDFKG